MVTTEPLLSVLDLHVSFPRAAGGEIEVVRGISFELKPGRILGIVGESGSGKTMSALSLLGLVPEPGQVKGSIRLEGRELSGLDEKGWCQVRGRDVAMVFQDALSGLNPVRTIGSVLTETVLRHSDVTRAQARERALETLVAVGIPKLADRMGVYPHQLSGGQRQRVMIALAIVNHPRLIVADEPTTALDNTIQAQILELLRSLLDQSSLILITHNLGVAATICDEVAVMYAGRICEVGPVVEVLRRPRHPYTNGLLASVPRFDPAKPPLTPIPGAPPTASEPDLGCLFAARCPRVIEICRRQRPALAGPNGHLLACHNPIPDA